MFLKAKNALIQGAFTLLPIIIIIVNAEVESQIAVLYSGIDQQGDSITVTDNIADLATVNFDNRVRSVCVTGTLLLYTSTNFNPDGYGGMAYFFGTNNYCANLKAHGGTISSVRFAGDHTDYTIPTLTTYEFINFQGIQKDYITDSEPVMSSEGKSLIITGSECWTIYGDEDYSGTGYCIQPPTPIPSFYFNLTTLQNNGFDGDTIASALKGCDCDD